MYDLLVDTKRFCFVFSIFKQILQKQTLTVKWQEPDIINTYIWKNIKLKEREGCVNFVIDVIDFEPIWCIFMLTYIKQLLVDIRTLTEFDF